MIMTLEELANNRDNTTITIDNSTKGLEIEPISQFVSTTNNLEITHGPIIVDRKSVFQGHVCRVNNKQELR